EAEPCVLISARICCLRSKGSTIPEVTPWLSLDDALSSVLVYSLRLWAFLSDCGGKMRRCRARGLAAWWVGSVWFASSHHDAKSADQETNEGAILRPPAKINAYDCLGQEFPTNSVKVH